MQAGVPVSMGDIYTALFTSALSGDKDCGGVVNLPLFSGEPVVGLDAGRPMLVRTPDAKLTFPNFARSPRGGRNDGPENRHGHPRQRACAD